MKSNLRLFSFLLIGGLFIFSCTKDEPAAPADPNQEASEMADGTWVVVSLFEDGQDISSTASGTFNFKDDEKTFNFSGQESGFAFSLNGTYAFESNSDSLRLTYSGSGGLAEYGVTNFTETTMTLSIDAFGTNRVTDLEKR